MIVRQRRMRRADVDPCVDLIRTHPIAGPRYGSAIDVLAIVWRDLLQSDAMITRVMEADEAGHWTICAVGVSVCVDASFLNDIKTPPLRWIGPELAKRLATGRSPVLSDKQLRDANAAHGLNLVVWEGCVRSGYESHLEVLRELAAGFIESHQGFRWNELISAQATTGQYVEFSLNTGGWWWDAEVGEYVVNPKLPDDVANRPHVVGITRELDARRPGSWIGALFKYSPPQCAFSRSEQSLLATALDGATDEELAEMLSLSVTTVKKTWLSICSRLAFGLPSLMPDDKASDGSAAHRGREKKRRLLTYLRDHPEELRPFSRKRAGRTLGSSTAI